jgi:hypothetical protein
LDNGVKDHCGIGLRHRTGLHDRLAGLGAELDLVAVVDEDRVGGQLVSDGLRGGLASVGGLPFDAIHVRAVR